MKKLFTLLLALTLLLGSGCGSKSASFESTDTAASEPVYGMAAAEAPAAMPEPAAPEMAQNAGDAGFLVSESAEPEEDALGQATGESGEVSNPAQKLIYRSNMTVETLEFDAAVSNLEQMASELGGFVESSEIWGDTSWQSDGSTRVVNRHASYVLRVPSNRFHEAVSLAGELGSVVSSGSSVENITSQFIDQEAREHSLEVQEERLLSMLEKAEDVDTLVILESRLSEVRYEIESIERQLRNWQQQVDYSTISVELQEVAVYTPTVTVRRSFGERLGTAFSDGWSGFVAGLQRFTLGLAEALPGLVLFVVIVAALALIGRSLARKIRKKRDSKRRAAEEDSRREGEN